MLFIIGANSDTKSFYLARSINGAASCRDDAARSPTMLTVREHVSRFVLSHRMQPVKEGSNLKFYSAEIFSLPRNPGKFAQLGGVNKIFRDILRIFLSRLERRVTCKFNA